MKKYQLSETDRATKASLYGENRAISLKPAQKKFPTKAWFVEPCISKQHLTTVRIITMKS